MKKICRIVHHFTLCMVHRDRSLIIGGETHLKSSPSYIYLLFFFSFFLLRLHKLMLSPSNWVVSVIVKYYIFLLWHQFAIDFDCDVRARDCFGMSDWRFFKPSPSQFRWQPETRPEMILHIATNSHSNL